VIRRTIAPLCVVVALAVLSASIPCFAGKDRDFHAVVSAIEAQYGVHHARIPLLGFATFCGRIAGAPGLKIAVFENVQGANGMSPDSLAESMQAAIWPEWQPLVRVREKGEFTIIFTNADEKKLKALIVCLDGDDATLLETKIKVSQIKKWMRDPQDARDLRDNVYTDAD